MTHHWGIKFIWLVFASYFGAGFVVYMYTWGVETNQVLPKILSPLPLVPIMLLWAGISKMIDWAFKPKEEK